MRSDKLTFCRPILHCRVQIQLFNHHGLNRACIWVWVVTSLFTLTYWLLLFLMMKMRCRLG